MSSSSLDDLGKLILRLSLGIFILLHGIAKLSGGTDGIAGLLVAKNLPGFFAHGAYIGELIAPILVILGLWTRVGGLIIVVNMLFAIGLVHMADLFTLGKSGGWTLELQGMYLFASLAVLLLGAGAYSVGGKSGRFN